MTTGTIRVKSIENLFENYKQHHHPSSHKLTVTDNCTSYISEVNKCYGASSVVDKTKHKSGARRLSRCGITDGQDDNNHNTSYQLPSSLKFNKNTMAIFVKNIVRTSTPIPTSSPPPLSTVAASSSIVEDQPFENIICSPNLIQMPPYNQDNDDYDDENGYDNIMDTSGSACFSVDVADAAAHDDDDDDEIITQPYDEDSIEVKHNIYIDSFEINNDESVVGNSFSSLNDSGISMPKLIPFGLMHDNNSNSDRNQSIVSTNSVIDSSKVGKINTSDHQHQFAIRLNDDTDLLTISRIQSVRSMSSSSSSSSPANAALNVRRSIISHNNHSHPRQQLLQPQHHQIPYQHQHRKLDGVLVTDGQAPPPSAVVLRNPRGNQPRTYSTDELYAALMDVKSGESIYR